MKLRALIATVGLTLVNLSLLVLLVMQVLHGSQRDELLAGRAHVEPEIQLPLQARAPVSLQAIQTQALFHQSRSFYVAPVAPAVVQPPPNARLVGVMSVPNRQPSAVIVNNATGVRSRVSVGGEVEGWSVSEITPRRVTVTLGDRTSEITTTSGAIAAGPSNGAIFGMMRVPNGATPNSAQSTAGAASTSSGIRVLHDAGSSSLPMNGATPVSVDAPRLYRPPTQ